MKKLVVISVFLFVFLIMISSVSAATYYMRSDGTAASKSSATSCSSSATAMDEGQHNSESFSNGDIITLCDDGGDFNEELDVNDNGITYTVASGDSVVFTGISPGSQDYTIHVTSDNVVLEKGNGASWEIRDTGGQDNMVGIHDPMGSASNVTLDGLTIGPDQTEGGLKIDRADNVVIKNSYIWNTGDNGGSEDEHIAIIGAAFNITIENCDFKADTLGGDGFVISGDAHDITIRYNKLYGWTYDSCGGECSEQFIDIKDEVYNINIYGNLFDTSVNYQAILVHNANSAQSLDDATIRGLYIYGNFFTNSAVGGVNIWARNSRDIEDVFIFSNIFFEASPSYAVQLTGGGSGEPSNYHVFNNVVLDSSSSSNHPINLADGNEEGGSNSLKNNIVENNLQGSDTQLLWNSGVPPITTTYNRWYDSDGTARCDDDGGTERDCDDINFGANNEIAQTTFTNRVNGLNLSTSSNIIPAEDLGALCPVCDLGIKEGYDFNSLGPNSGPVVRLVSRDNYNSGTWGKGAVVYQSSGSFCGDLICEGTETPSTCSIDCGPSTECSDSIDNDNDGDVDLLDSGCMDVNDNDESNCGDGQCEGGETPSTCSFDCGPTSICTSGADTNFNNIVEIGELLTFISDWKAGSVTIGNLLTAIGEWKSGC